MHFYTKFIIIINRLKNTDCVLFITHVVPDNNSNG